MMELLPGNMAEQHTDVLITEGHKDHFLPSNKI